MKNRSKQIKDLKIKVIAASNKHSFIHHQWFVKYHLEIVEEICFDLLDTYQNASRDVVLAMVWIHDYGKIVDFGRQHEATLTEVKN